MTFTYNSDLTNNYVDKVRFLIGDNVEDKHLVEDEEIQSFLVDFSYNMNAACAAICEAIAARFARDGDVRVSTYAISKTTVYQKYKDLAKNFRRQGGTNLNAFIVPCMFVADKDANEDNESLTHPSFKRGLFDNPSDTSPTDKEELA